MRLTTALLAACCAIVHLGMSCQCVYGQADKVKIHFGGTVTDAKGDPVKEGKIKVSFTGGLASSRTFRNGAYGFDVEIEKAKLPLMIKLAFHADDKQQFPTARSVEHLSPRLPKNRIQELHVVMYTDDQLKNAQLENPNLDELHAEAQQIETSLLDWMQSDAEFRGAYKKYDLAKLVNNRRKLIFELSSHAAIKSRLPLKYTESLFYSLRDEGPLSKNIQKWFSRD
jgi:hypothetical protein